MNRLRLAVLSAPLVCLAAPVHAATVAIVRPPSASAEVTQALVRLHGELLSVGLQVEIANGPADRELGTSSSRAWLEQFAAQRGASAVIDIVGNAVAVDVWIIDAASARVEVARVAPEPATRNPAEQLAIRAIEVLRSSFLELDLKARAQQGKPAAKPPVATLDGGSVSQPESRPERFGFEVGAAALTGLDGIGTALVPLVRLDWAAQPWFLVQATLAGFGSRPTVATTVGNARVAQQYGVLGGSYRFRSGHALQPFVALSAGVLHTSVAGYVDLPKQGHSVARWSFLLDGSVGVGLHLSGRYHLSLAAHVQMAEPYVAIHFEDTVVATSGYPNLLLTLTVGAWL